MNATTTRTIADAMQVRAIYWHKVANFFDVAEMTPDQTVAATLAHEGRP